VLSRTIQQLRVSWRSRCITIRLELKNIWFDLFNILDLGVVERHTGKNSLPVVSRIRKNHITRLGIVIPPRKVVFYVFTIVVIAKYKKLASLKVPAHHFNSNKTNVGILISLKLKNVSSFSIRYFLNTLTGYVFQMVLQ